ncbi:MAG TPA: glycosyltransferase family 2 protein [candidate division Zixibacteria bacterium]|nr:glycosyltransferase family 2 protein [candidate division Zixibacteria bacterium]
MIRDHKTLVVIPAYNAARYLPELLDRLGCVWSLNDCLVVDDGSVDDTPALLSSAGANFIRFKNNRGKGAALRAGLSWARDNGYRTIVTLDADLQHRPEELPSLLNAHHRSQAAATVGSRFPGASEMPWPRQISNCLTSLALSLTAGQRIRDCQCGFRALDVSAALTAAPRECGFMYESELLFRLCAAGAPVAEAPISAVYQGQPSSIRPARDTLRFLRLLWRRFWY